MYAEVTWVLVSLGTQVQPKIVLDNIFQTIFPFLVTMFQRNYEPLDGRINFDERYCTESCLQVTQQNTLYTLKWNI